MKNQTTKNWREELDREIPDGSWGFRDKAPELMSDEMKRYLKEYFARRQENTKSFIKSLLASQKAEILGEIELEKRKLPKGWSENPPMTKFRKGYNQAIEDLEKLKEKLK